MKRLKRIFLYGLLLIALIAAGWYRWLWLHKGDPSATELWGRMDKAAQEKVSVEINLSYIRLNPKCRRSALDIESYPDALLIKVKCDDGRDDEGIGNIHLINFSEH